MSKLIVQVCMVSAVEDHPNADHMKIATVKGWRTCIRFDPETGKSQFNHSDKCIFVPPDSVVPIALAERLGVVKYLSPVKHGNAGEAITHFRVKAARLRSVASYGLIFEASDNPNWQVGDDVAEYYGIIKWEPPEATRGDAAKEHPAFHRYTGIEHWANFPEAFEIGEQVLITEKIHGRNCRIGLVMTENGDGLIVPTMMAGSHTLPRKEKNAQEIVSDYWKPANEQMRKLLRHLNEGNRNVVAFGEIFGKDQQDLTYGINQHGAVGFRLFDIAIDGQYVDFDPKKALCEQFGIEMVPLLYRGPYSPDIVRELTDGPTTLCSPEKLGKFKGREGVVVTPVVERLMGNFDRLILRSVSADFLARSGGTDAH